MALSRRGEHSKAFPAEMLRFADRYLENAYHKESNPQGIINLGLAESQLCEDLWQKKLNEGTCDRFEPNMQYYSEWRGTHRFRSAVAEFLTERLQAFKPIDPNNIICTSGAGAALDLLTHAFADPGDCFLCLTPLYSVIAGDMGNRSQVELHHIELPGRVGATAEWNQLLGGIRKEAKDRKEAFCYTKGLLEEGFQDAMQKGKKVKGLIILNPGNPTGDVFDENLIREALQFCHEHDLHAFMDEVYALSVWAEHNRFRSVLSLSDIPDPQKTHFVWSFSKDLGLSGFRCGIIHSWNPDLLAATARLCYFASVPSLIQEKLRSIIQDKNWLDQVYFPTNLTRMRETFEKTRRWCETLGIVVHPGTEAAYFVWADFSKYLESPTKEGERALFNEIFDHGVYIVPGTAMFSSQPGWFRITFTMHKHILDTGLQRIEEVLRRRRT